MKREEVFRCDPELIGGAPAFTGTHVAVDNLIVYLKNGYSLDQFLEHFRGVSRKQVVAFLDMAEDALLSQEMANLAKYTPSPEIIESEIGPVISGRGVTVYDVMEAYDEGDNIYTISSTYNISPLQVKAAIEYIEKHRERLEANDALISARAASAPSEGLICARAAATGPIGLFDSGVGGTSVLREVRALLPNEPLLYLADQARCPYGSRDEATLRRFALENTHWLLDHGAKLIVVACNTASAAALHWLRTKFPTIKFVGIVPAVKPAALSTRSSVVGLLATPATMRGRLLREVMTRWTNGVRVIEQAAPDLVTLVEGGHLEDEAASTLLASYLQPMVAAGADTVVLGCTHYSYLTPLIRQLTPNLRIIDPAPAIARQVKRVLKAHRLTHPTADATLRYATTGSLDPFRALLARLDLPKGQVKWAQIGGRKAHLGLNIK